MKHLLFSFLCLLGAGEVFGQEPAPQDSLPDFARNVREHPHVYASTKFGALTNSVATTGIFKFGTTDFLDEEDKEAILAPVGSYLRYGFVREMSFGYRAPWYKVFDTYKMGQGFGIRNSYYNSAVISRDLLNLVLYGNAPYAGEELSLDRSGMETWYYTSLDYHFDVLIDSVQPVSFSISMHVGHDHNYYHVNSGSLYTEPDGSFLDLTLDYQLMENQVSTHPFAGFGVSLGASTSFKLSKTSQLDLEFRDAGVMSWNNGRLLETDTNFRFQGFRFDNVFEINDSLRNHTDERYTDAFFYQSEDNYMAALPFYAAVTYRKKLDNRRFQELSIKADYRYLTGFYPRLSIGTEINTGFHQSLLVSASAGGYNWFSLNTGYEFRFARYWKLQARVFNINGLVLPGVFGGAMGSLHLSYEL